MKIKPSSDQPKGKSADQGDDNPLRLFEQMVLIRCVEERLIKLFADGEVPGFIHLSIGQEAVAVGVMATLTPQDTIASTHRGHGHALAKGVGLDGFFAELLARDSGLCRGRGGSMHVADLSIGMLGANGIVGAGLSIALGSALAHQSKGNASVAISFFGDGALAEGLLHETLNLAKLWRLPMLFVCENNGWGEFLPTEKQLSFSLESLSASYGIPYQQLDGNDVLAVTKAAAAVIASVRDGAGPAVLECMTTRIRGHFEGDGQKYRDSENLARDIAADPIARFESALIAKGHKPGDLGAMRTGIEAKIEAAIGNARLAAYPDIEAARNDVYTPARVA